MDISSQLLLFVCSVIFFEITFQFARFVLDHLVQWPGLVPVQDDSRNHTTKQDDNATNKLSKKYLSSDVLINLGPSYICSIVHSVIVSIRGIYHLIEFYPKSTIHKLAYPDVGIIQTNLFFCAYLFYDLFHIIGTYPKLGGVDTILHHAAFMVCSVINGYYEVLPFSFGWLIIGEISTVFLNVRWFLIKTGRGATQALQVVQQLFAMTFFVTRVLIYGMGTINLFQQRTHLQALVHQGRVPKTFLGISLFFIVIGCLLNMFWFKTIATMAFAKNKSTTTTTKTTNSKLASSPRTVKMMRTSSASSVATTSTENQFQHEDFVDKGKKIS